MVFDDCASGNDGMVSALVVCDRSGVIDGGNIMTINYPQLANFVRKELEQFLSIMQQSNDEERRRSAVEQLWVAVNRVEAFSYAPSDEHWATLSEAQRWGYLRLESYVGTALYELRQSQRTVWRGLDSRPTISVTSAEARYT
jgi:hypothetical protein